MTRLINKEMMNLKVAPPKRLLLMETMTRANGSYRCQNQAPPPWSSRTDLMTIKTVTYKKIKRHGGTNKLFGFSFNESNDPQPVTHLREETRLRRERREREIARQRETNLQPPPSTPPSATSYLDFILSVYCIRQLRSIDHY